MSVGSSVDSRLLRIGQTIGRTAANRLTENQGPFLEVKDAVKFVCKDLWYYFFLQQASRLQANKKGVFVIHDTSFPPLQSLAKACAPMHSPFASAAPLDPSLGPLSHPSLVSASPQVDDMSPSSVRGDNHVPHDPVSQRAYLQLSLWKGVIESFLESVGFTCTVEVVIQNSIPACAFQVTCKQSGSSEVLNPARLLGSTTEAASI
jgi:hypothetical protein